ncbi:DUF4147 domain-containing protein [Leptospira kemamanensis]|uniref:DUF4147 domain-containing protein n=1 Tax=Leptospira kemamanensis TaxID=2484942 RepID=A0A4V3JQ66_9LEPT|nr:DUF4147 domain-containing protein [Leptospira kemamanensis]TGL53153.1 DUF4147 domain-containing protein [Leptospira kemamanensis]
MNSLKEDVLDFFQEGILVAKPEQLFPEFWKEHPEIFSQIHDSSKNVYVFALGKAGDSMAKAFAKDFKIKKGWVLTKYGHVPKESYLLENQSIWEYREAAHPVPDENSVIHAKEILSGLQSLGSGDRLVVLLSGGGSSLFEIPIDGVTIEKIQEIQSSLLKKGTPIQKLNEERKKYSLVKGGKLLQLLHPDLDVLTFVISDVLGDDPSLIASGPTYPSSHYYILGNLTRSLDQIWNSAGRKGYKTKLISSVWDKSSEETSLLIEAEFLKAIQSPEKQLIMLGGELVCPVVGDGKGGRNMELTLRVSILLEKHKSNRKWMFLSGGTDGTDGPTDSAGGVVDQDSFQKMIQHGWDPTRELLHSNSYAILKDIGSTLDTGPTGTNVNDIILLLVSES